MYFSICFTYNQVKSDWKKKKKKGHATIIVTIGYVPMIKLRKQLV